MPLVATDDAARRQWFFWLGPTNSPWPFEARGRSWVMAVLIVPALWTVLGLAFLGGIAGLASVPGITSPT